MLTPLVTVMLSAWLDDEPISAGLVLGGLPVLVGVYLAARRGRWRAGKVWRRGHTLNPFGDRAAGRDS